MPVKLPEMETNNAGSDEADSLESSEVDDNDENENQDSESLPDDDFSEDDDVSEDDEEGVFQKLDKVESKKRKYQADSDKVGVEESEKKRKKKKKKMDTNVKPPTAEEMTRLRETENLFHSNLFRLQIEEMIKEVRPKKYERKSMKQWLEKLSQFLLNVDDISNFSVHNLGEYKIPLCKLRKEPESNFNFLKPSSINIWGSYKAGCCLGPGLTIDVCVTIPKKCFLKTDYLNGRYHYKRALYLAQLAKLLDGNKLLNSENGCEFCTKSGDPMKPTLLLHPAGNLNKVEVYIHVVPEEGRFKLSRFLPDKCNVKSTWWTEGREDFETPTPHYNNSVTEDLVVSTNEEFRHAVLEANPNLKEAITLLRVWLRQRELDKGYGSFSGYIASMYIVYLFRSRKVNTFMSSYQIVRNVWLTISQTDWTKDGISLCTAKSQELPSIELFHKHFDVVFLDITGYCNFTAQMSNFTYLQLKQEAALAIQCLDNPHMNSFNALFMTPMPFIRQFDHIIRIQDKQSILKISKESSLETQLDTLCHTTLLASQVITRLLQQAIEDRLALMTVKLDPPICWNVKHKCTQKVKTVTIGLRLNSNTALSVIDKGPSANLPEAANFRELWGEKSELRRFKDGNVCEAVVWAEAGVPIAKRRTIVKDIVLYLLKNKLNIESSNVVYLADQLEPLIQKTNMIPHGFEYGTGEEAARQVIDAYDKLAKQLRAISDLPLDISSIQGVSPVFRFSAVFPPLAYSHNSDKNTDEKEKSCLLLKNKCFKVPNYTEPVEVILQLGLSRKWPEDVDAVKRIRAAFNLQIAQSLKNQCKLQVQAFPSYVDVYKDGFVFRIRVAYAREVVLLKEMKTPDGKIMYRDTPESIELEKSTINLPKISGALYGLSQQCLGYGPATCIAKRWLHSQLFNSSLFPDIATELLMAYLFLAPQPFRVLIQPQTGFLRFLNLLATTNWYLEPIIINFNDDMKREDILEVESYFRNERASLPPLFIATHYDRTGSLWTKEAPILPVLAWVTKIAAESLRVLESHFLTSGNPTDCKEIFRPPMHIYDVCIKLRPRLSPLYSYGIDYKSVGNPLHLKVPECQNKIPITGFDPVQIFLTELRENYGEFALFFHDTYGGDVIGVLFKPSVLEPQEFKVSQMNCRKPLTEGNSTKLILNIDALIEDFYVIGKHLVVQVERKQKCKTC